MGDDNDHYSIRDRFQARNTVVALIDDEIYAFRNVFVTGSLSSGLMKRAPIMPQGRWVV
jgi:hypothetical protein